VQGIHVTLLFCLEFGFLVFLMTLLWYYVHLILRTNSFFVISTKAINQLEICTLDMCMKVPGILFKGFWRCLYCHTVSWQLFRHSLLPAHFLWGDSYTASCSRSCLLRLPCGFGNSD